MIKETAITFLYGMRAENLNLDDSYTHDRFDALTLAIRSLEQGTVTDFADKCRVCGAKYGAVNPLLEELEKALSIYDDTAFINVKYIRRLLDKYKAVEQLPPVNPQPNTGHWIPISSEKLPEDGSWNLFTDGKNISIERYKADALDHFFPNGRWFSFDEAIAWMPLPKPYRAESEEI